MTMLDTSFNDITHPQVVRGRGSPSDGDLAANAVFIPELEIKECTLDGDWMNDVCRAAQLR